MKKIAVLTSGGDSPGMNSAIAAILKTAARYNVEVLPIENGYTGIFSSEFVRKTNRWPYNFDSQGGTILGSSRYPDFALEEVQEVAKGILEEEDVDGLIVIGGDGTYKGAYQLHRLGLKVVALPGTIDNDIARTDYTIGFDTALNTIVEAIDKLRDTAASHKRCFIVEVMGRHCQDLALYSAMATGSEIIITNTFIPDKDDIAAEVARLFKTGRKSVVITVSENIIEDIKGLAQHIQKKTRIDTREVVLGHLQRGGRPSAFDRILATQMGMRAVEALIDGDSGFAVSHRSGAILLTPLEDVFDTKITTNATIVKKITKVNQS